MFNEIINEYNELLRKHLFIEQQLENLPSGYISKKVIKGRFQNYLQKRVDNKIVSKYLKKDEIEDYYNKINDRKLYINEIKQISERILQLEEAALLLNKFLYYRLQIYKLSLKMDSIDSKVKRESLEFASVLNSIEGVLPSEVLTSKLKCWEKNEKSFLTIFEETLSQYGFFGDK